jgi:hypothetical protein
MRTSTKPTCYSKIGQFYYGWPSNAHTSNMSPLPESRSLSSVTLGKHFIAKSFLSNTFFRHSTKTLLSVENHSAKKSTRQIKNRKKTPKNCKTFFKIIGITLQQYSFTCFGKLRIEKTPKNSKTFFKIIVITL